MSTTKTLITALPKTKHLSTHRKARPRLLAYSPSYRLKETCGCGLYTEGACGMHHAGGSGPGCGHYTDGVCGRNRADNDNNDPKCGHYTEGVCGKHRN